MFSSCKSVSLMFVVVVSIAAANPAAIAEPLVAVSHSSSAIEWEPRAGLSSLTLVVAGPDGFVFKKQFLGHEQPVFALEIEGAGTLPDGSYNWELRGRSTPEGISQAELTQSGVFRIVDGSLVVPNSEGRLEVPDKMIVNDPLIVKEKACFGIDCDSFQVFTDEVILLRDGTPGIKFLDSSSAPGEPTSDWQLTINDPGPGGADKFSIDDLEAGTTPFTVEAGARNHLLYLGNGGPANHPGQVGIGTSTPEYDLHVVNPETDDAAFRAIFALEGQGPTIRIINSERVRSYFDLMINPLNGRFLIQAPTLDPSLPPGTAQIYPLKIEETASENLLRLGLAMDNLVEIGSSTDTGNLKVWGAAAVQDAEPSIELIDSTGLSQTWDLVGSDLGFAIRDVTHGSLEPFQIEPSAPSDSLFIAADGKVGLGTSSPSSQLDVVGFGPGVRLGNTGPAGGGWSIFTNGNTGRLVIKDLSTDDDPVKIEDGSNENLLRVGINTSGAATSNTVSIGSVFGDAVLQVAGSIEVDGAVAHADYVFDPDYELESIADHAASMWREKHLPALRKAPDGLKGPIDLVSHQMGILEEVEKAHIYIEQLHDTIETLESRIEQLEKGAGSSR